MDASRFDRVSKAFAQRRARRAVTQEATPTTAPDPGHAPELLFVQTFRAGAISPVEGVEGRYTLTLEAGSGQTIHFSNRPDRVVGSRPTPNFLETLGFFDDNPPNAALVVETAPGKTDVAVVELFSPVHDEASGGVTYEVAPLANWQAELGVGLQEAPTDLAALEPSFGAAHLFIDGELGCSDGEIDCIEVGSNVHMGTIKGSSFDNFCSAGFLKEGRTYINICVPCTTPVNEIRDVEDVVPYWAGQCNAMFPSYNGNCLPFGWCEQDSYFQDACPNFS